MDKDKGGDAYQDPDNSDVPPSKQRQGQTKPK
jgi:hypothetical protein